MFVVVVLPFRIVVVVHATMKTATTTKNSNTRTNQPPKVLKTIRKPSQQIQIFAYICNCIEKAVTTDKFRCSDHNATTVN